MVAEEHGSGHQMLRFRIWPRYSAFGVSVAGLMAILATTAAADGAWMAALLLAGTSLLIGGRILYESALAMHKLTQALQGLAQPAEKTVPGSTAPTPKTVVARAYNQSS
jgi:hypothetical protein